MTIVTTALLLAAALAAAPAVASDGLEVFTASTTGELTIDAEGRVVDASLDPKKLGDTVVDGFRNQILQWRFEPIVQDGAPVRAKAHMQLDLLVIRQPGVEGLRLAFDQVQFVDRSEAATEALAASAAERSMAPPRYPATELERGVGGRVMLVLSLDRDGRVLKAATEGVLLYGEELRGQEARHARSFSRAAELAASRWRIPGIEGGLVRVPVNYAMRGMASDRWTRTHRVPVETPAWVAVEREAKKVVALSAGGTASSERWKLLAPAEG